MIQVPLECSSGQPHLEVERESLALVASVQEDEREESELGELEDTEGTTTTSTHPLTARTSEEKDSLDGEDSEGCETERRFRNIEDWNFSSVQTVDEKSIDEVGFPSLFYPAGSLNIISYRTIRTV